MRQILIIKKFKKLIISTQTTQYKFIIYCCIQIIVHTMAKNGSKKRGLRVPHEVDLKQAKKMLKEVEDESKKKPKKSDKTVEDRLNVVETKDIYKEKVCGLFSILILVN